MEMFSAHAVQAWVEASWRTINLHDDAQQVRVRTEPNLWPGARDALVLVEVEEVNESPDALSATVYARLVEVGGPTRRPLPSTVKVRLEQLNGEHKVIPNDKAADLRHNAVASFEVIQDAVIEEPPVTPPPTPAPAPTALSVPVAPARHHIDPTAMGPFAAAHPDLTQAVQMGVVVGGAEYGGTLGMALMVGFMGQRQADGLTARMAEQDRAWQAQIARMDESWRAREASLMAAWAAERKDWQAERNGLYALVGQASEVLRKQATGRDDLTLRFVSAWEKAQGELAGAKVATAEAEGERNLVALQGEHQEALAEAEARVAAAGESTPMAVQLAQEINKALPQMAKLVGLKASLNRKKNKAHEEAPDIDMAAFMEGVLDGTVDAEPAAQLILAAIEGERRTRIIALARAILQEAA